MTCSDRFSVILPLNTVVKLRCVPSSTGSSFSPPMDNSQWRDSLWTQEPWGDISKPYLDHNQGVLYVDCHVEVLTVRIWYLYRFSRQCSAFSQGRLGPRRRGLPSMLLCLTLCQAHGKGKSLENGLCGEGNRIKNSVISNQPYFVWIRNKAYFKFLLAR